MTIMPRLIVESIQNIFLATRCPTYDSAPYLVYQSHLQILQNAVDWLGCKQLRKIVKWSNLSEIEKNILKKFIRQIQGQSPHVWFSSLALTGPFWKEAIDKSSSWFACELDQNLDVPPKYFLGSPSPYREKNHQISFLWLGHHSFFLQYRLEGGQKWNCLINPHEASEITISDWGILYARAVPSACPISSLPPIDTVIVTDTREDHYDPVAVSFLQIYQPVLFLAGGIEEDPNAESAILPNAKARYLMCENRSISKLTLTYIPPRCREQGNAHSGSWIFSLPCTTYMNRFTHIVLLGTAECCLKEDFVDHCKEISKSFPEITYLLLPIESLAMREDYKGMMAAGIHILHPLHYFCTHFGTWPFHLIEEYPPQVLHRELMNSDQQ